MRFLKFSVVLFFMLFTTQANAAQAGGYVGGALGMTILTDSTVYPEFGGSAVLESDVGFGLSFAGGYAFGNGARAELELAYRRNGGDRLDGSAFDGAVSSFAIMGNGAFDFDLGQWVPYVGGGIGLGIVHARIDNPASGATFMDDAGIAFAFQAMAGIGYKISPQVVLSFDYRLFATTDVTLTDEFGFDYEAEYLTHSFMLGGRYNF